MKKQKYDFESEDNRVLKELDKLEKLITKLYGSQCKRKAVGCSVCKVWAAFDNFKLSFF